MAIAPRTYNVGGVMLKQPCKIRWLGYCGSNVTDMQKTVHEHASTVLVK